LGKSIHAMTLEQNGVVVKGRYRSQFQWADVAGQVEGDQLTFQVRLGTQANWLDYRFQGQVTGETMAGTVDLGEFWQARWTAQRITQGN
jgi:L-seryl-tRNA(Ser) seleniumtransferase